MHSVDADAAETGDISMWWYAVALAVYIPVGIVTKLTVLNWIVGPLFPLIVLYIGPTLATRLRARIGTDS